jgi:ribosomal protein L37AE/L43A
MCFSAVLALPYREEERSEPRRVAIEVCTLCKGPNRELASVEASLWVCGMCGFQGALLWLCPTQRTVYAYGVAVGVAVSVSRGAAAMYRLCL